jgi:hypothetical protein
MGFADKPDYWFFLRLPMGLYLSADTLLMIKSIHLGKSKLGDFKIPFVQKIQQCDIVNIKYRSKINLTFL